MNDLLLFVRYINRIIIAISAGLALCMLSSCHSSHSVVDRQVYATTQHDTIRLTQLRVLHDSVYVHDSVSFEQRGETVRITKIRDRWHTTLDTLHDTVYISRKADTIMVKEHNENKVTEVKLSFWQTIRNYIICALLILACYYVLRWYGRRYTG